MATNEKIKLDITSAFDPGGFSKASRAVNNLGGEMKKGGKTVNELMTAFGSADGALGNFASTFTKLGAAFKGGGGIALVAAGAALLVSKFMEMREAAAKMAEEQRKAWRDDLIKRMDSGLSDLKTKHAQIADEIERGAKAAESLAKAYEGLANSEVMLSNAKADRQVALLEGERQTKLSAETDPTKRKAIELDFERQIFEVKKEASKFERDQKAWKANEKVGNAEKSVKAEQDKLSGLLAKEADLKAIISSDAQAEYNKKNPMPQLNDGKKDLRNMGGAVATGNVPGALIAAGKTLYDQKEYEKAMDQWIKEAGEFTKEQERIKKDAAEELLKVQAGIKDAPSAIKNKSIGVSDAKNERDSILESNQASMTREDIQRSALSENQIAFDKTLEVYQAALDKRAKVEEQITRQEEKIGKLKEKEKDREDKRTQWNQQSTQAKQLGAAGWNQQQTAAADAKDDTDKGTKHEASWVANARKRMSTGAKLSKKDMARIANFDDWNKLQGVNPFDPGKAAADQLKRLDDNLTELKKLNTNLENSLKVN